MKIHLDELEKGLGRVQIETMASRMDDYEMKMAVKLCTLNIVR